MERESEQINERELPHSKLCAGDRSVALNLGISFSFAVVLLSL